MNKIMITLCLLPFMGSAQNDSAYSPERIKTEILALQQKTYSLELRQERFKKMHNAGVFALALGVGTVLLNEYAGSGNDGITGLGMLMGIFGTGIVLYAPNELDGNRIYFFKRRRAY